VIAYKYQRKDEEMKMEEHRCGMTVAVTIDCCSANLIDSAITETRDPRYKYLQSSVILDVEDSRCNPVVMYMEDPRCKELFSQW
jgi:hypothetical protein